MSKTTEDDGREGHPAAAVLRPRILVRGNASSSAPTAVHRYTLLHSSTPLSLWGGVDPITGVVVDHTHPLCGRSVAGAVLSLPSGRGSCTASQVLLELILNGTAPKAIVTRDVDAILCVGAVVAEETFDDDEIEGRVPSLVCVGERGFEALDRAVGGDGEGCASFLLPGDDGDGRSARRATMVVGRTEQGVIRSELEATSSAPELSRMNDDGDFKKDECPPLWLTPHERSLLEDDTPPSTAAATAPALRMALRVVSRIASLSNAPRLLPVTRGHIDAVTYIGPGGLRFVRRLVESGGRVSIPTTLNSGSTDRRRWSMLGIDPALGRNATDLGDAYLALGCRHSFTCAPYVLDDCAPTYGEKVAWGESNAVVFANSILGARTDKTADYLDICAAICGRVPESGMYLDENRRPKMIAECDDVVRECVLPWILDGDNARYRHDLDAFWPTLGYLVGSLSDGRVPLLTGLELLRDFVSNDDWKAFCAAFGTTASVPLFHVAGLTPEAREEEAVQAFLAGCGGDGSDGMRKRVTNEMLMTAFRSLNGGGGHGRGGSNDEEDVEGRVDLVALGNPHLSLSECETLSGLVSDLPRRRADRSNSGGGATDPAVKHRGVRVIATLSRRVHDEASERGYVRPLEKFGVEFINDTCWCMLIDPPVVPPAEDAVILTNSGKYAHYGPGLTGRMIRFGGLRGCIEAARTGKYSSDGRFGALVRPRWLPGFEVGRRSFSTTPPRWWGLPPPHRHSSSGRLHPTAWPCNYSSVALVGKVAPSVFACSGRLGRAALALARHQ